VQSFVGRLLGASSAERDGQPVDEDEAALEALKRRYARGEIDEAEFERRTATLLENESVDDARERIERGDYESRPIDDRESRPTNDRGSAGGRERDPEYET